MVCTDIPAYFTWLPLPHCHRPPSVCRQCQWQRLMKRPHSYLSRYLFHRSLSVVRAGIEVSFLHTSPSMRLTKYRLISLSLCGLPLQGLTHGTYLPLTKVFQSQSLAQSHMIPVPLVANNLAKGTWLRVAIKIGRNKSPLGLIRELRADHPLSLNPTALLHTTSLCE